MLELHGIVPPILTPLNADESVDEAGLRRLISRLIDGGVHGIYLLGSTGEQPALLEHERARAVRIGREEIRGRVPLVVGCMASSTLRAISNIRSAEECGADAVAVTPPHYFPSQGPAEQVAHYGACALAARGPVLIYNIPSTTKVMLSPETIHSIATLPNVIGVKDSSTDLTHFLKLVDRKPHDRPFSCLIGAAPLIGPSVAFGGDGAVPGIANLDPVLSVQVYDAARRGDLKEARALQRRLTHLMRLLALGPPIVCLKTALELMGVCGKTACAPFQPLGEQAREHLRDILAEHGLV